MKDFSNICIVLIMPYCITIRCCLLIVYTDIYYMVIVHIILRWGGMIGPISGKVLFEVVYINKWNTSQEAAS